MTTLAVVGSGWRAEFFIRLAKRLPGLELSGVVVRNPEKASAYFAEYGAKTYSSVAELIADQKPDFVVSAVTWAQGPIVIDQLVEAGIPVLSETPPASTAHDLFELWDKVGNSGLVQVAEQYPLLPMHAARIAAVGQGVIGEATSVQVSSTHGYHAVALMRSFLGHPMGMANVNASRFTAPLVDPLTRDAWTMDSEPKHSGTTLATIDFGNGKSGLYDFTDNQWHNQLRHRRIVIRGSHGEIQDDQLIRLASKTAITTSSFNRYQLGQDLNLDGHDLEHISLNGEVIWSNPFIGMRLMDEEIAIATLMTQMAQWVSAKGPEPYPLAQASQDHLVSIAIDESLDKEQKVSTPNSPWSKK